MAEINLSMDQAKMLLDAGYQQDDRFKQLAAQANFVPGIGPIDAEVMVIGEAPGRNEDAKREPFCGQSGEVLNALLGAVGLRRHNVYITNIVKYRPPNNRTPYPAEVEWSMEYFRDEWECVTPKLTVMLGSTAVNALLGFGPMKGRVGSILTLGKGHKFLAMYHPAYILRNRTQMPEYRETWVKAYQSVVQGR